MCRCPLFVDDREDRVGDLHSHTAHKGRRPPSAQVLSLLSPVVSSWGHHSGSRTVTAFLSQEIRLGRDAAVHRVIVVTVCC
jgi:hypothetical protein